MIRLIFITILFLFSHFLSLGQLKVDTLGVTDFNTTISGADKYIPLLTEKTAEIINSSGRVLLVDMTSNKSINNVIKRAQENYKSNWIDDKSKINPKKIIVGEINVLKLIRSVSTTNPGYKSSVQIILKLIETETSKILNSSEFNGQSAGISLTQETSIQESVNEMSNAIYSWVNSVFPLYLDLVKIRKENSRSIEEVVISGGSNQKIQNGTYFDIIYYDNSTTPPIPELIGYGEVVSILNENYSVLKITDGDKNEIKKFLTSSANQIKFKSK